MKEGNKNINSLKLTDFSLRHFDSKFGGTKILNLDPKNFEERINLELDLYNTSEANLSQCVVNILDGYAPFCKLVAIKNFTDARVGTMPIDLSNYQYIRHGYSKRRDGEFETFNRWLELPVSSPKANYLMLVLYDKEQIEKEAIADYNKKMAEGGIESIGLEEPGSFLGNWGIVAILGQHRSDEEPMKPETFDRNYMPIEFGGSGLKYPKMPIKTENISEKSYDESISKYKSEMEDIRVKRKVCVDFWKKNVTVK